MSAQSTFSKNFLVTFGDLLTLLLCFFILIYEQNRLAIKNSEQNQVDTKNTVSFEVQNIGTSLAKQYLERHRENAFNDTILNKKSVLKDGVVFNRGYENLSKRFLLWEKVSHEKLNTIRNRKLYAETCDKDVIETLLMASSEKSMTLRYVPQEGCKKKTTLFMR